MLTNISTCSALVGGVYFGKSEQVQLQTPEVVVQFVISYGPHWTVGGPDGACGHGDPTVAGAVAVAGAVRLILIAEEAPRSAMRTLYFIFSF